MVESGELDEEDEEDELGLLVWLTVSGSSWHVTSKEERLPSDATASMVALPADWHLTLWPIVTAVLVSLLTSE